MKRLSKSTIYIFIAITIIVTTAWLAVIINNMTKEKDFLIEKTISDNAIYDENTSALIDRHMAEISENIKVIRDADEFNLFLDNPTDQNYEDSVQLFKRIMNNKENYEELRYIDVNGDEIIRVDHNGSIDIISQEDLQYKGDRYYFKEAILLDHNEIYVSQLDLNVENEKIEEPYRPMLRFATTVYNSNNELAGIIIVNYNADYFVELISEHNDYEGIGTFKFYILNKLGQFIIHPEDQLNYSYMFDQTSELVFEDINKELWDKMVADNFMGSYVDDDKVYTYYDVLTKAKNANEVYEQSWTALQVLDTSSFITFKTIMNRLFFNNKVIILIIIIISSFALAYFMEKLRLKEDQLEITKKIAESTNDSVVITNGETEIEYVNKAYEESTGYSFDEVNGLKPSRFKSGKHSKEFYNKMWQSINENGQWEGLLWDKKKDGLLYPKKLKILEVKNKKKTDVNHYIGIFSDLSSNKRKTDTYESIDYKDGQLVIPNEDMMIELLGKSIQKENYNFMIVYIAIENYNQLISFNDDEVLNIPVIFTELIRPLLNEEDFIAQTGRNLFAIIIGIDNIKQTPVSFVNYIHSEISKMVNIKERDLFFKTRIGVSCWPEDTKDIKKLLLNSMIALEWTNHRKEFEIAFFDETMIEQLQQENEIEGYLRKAIENNELSLVYQPQVEITTGKVIGMEALLRWNNDQLGFVSPAVFIPIAEKSNLMIDIGNWVIENVCEELKCLDNNCFFNESNLRCAINLSVIQMEEVGFVDNLFKSIDMHNIKSSRLEMEITESLLLKNKDKNVETLNKIRERGISIAIDDFGTGYSSLSYLNTMPIDKMKIDRSFIKNYPETDDGKLAQILVEMSKSLNMKVLMEGAETKDQIDYLKSVGCDYIQGFYYSKPLSIKQLIDYVSKNNTDFKS